MSELEGDRVEGTPHPRETFVLYGHDRAERTIVEALESGRLHHAWLIGGPEGIGKATLAYRLARRLLAGWKPGSTSLTVAPDDPVARKIAAQSHPDLVVLRRIPRKDGKALGSNIPVDLVRRALDVFGTTSGSGGWRICIIDSADDLDRGGANALLKVVEEPPPKALFLIVSHAPQRLLPTIRSRCRKLDLEPLGDEALAQALVAASVASADDPDLLRAVGVAGGSVKRAVERLDPEVLSLIEGVRTRLGVLPQVDMKALLALAEDIGGRGRDADFAIALDAVEMWVSERIRAGAGAGAGHLLALTEAWEAIRRSTQDAETFNLDRRPLVIAMFQSLAAAVRRAQAA